MLLRFRLCDDSILNRKKDTGTVQRHGDGSFVLKKIEKRSAGGSCPLRFFLIVMSEKDTGMVLLSGLLPNSFNNSLLDPCGY